MPERFCRKSLRSRDRGCWLCLAKDSPATPAYPGSNERPCPYQTKETATSSCRPFEAWPIQVTVPVLEFDKPTANGRVYSRELAEKMIDVSREKLQLRQFIGGPVDGAGRIPLSDMGFVVLNLAVTPETLTAKIEFLDCYGGDWVLEMHENRLLRYFPCGTGSLNRQDDGTYLVSDDFVLDGIGCEVRPPREEQEDDAGA